MKDLASRLTGLVAQGNMQGVAEVLEELRAKADSPEICTPETLSALERARTLALVQRSLILARLREASARRLYGDFAPAEYSTWRLEG